LIIKGLTLKNEFFEDEHVLVCVKNGSKVLKQPAKVIESTFRRVVVVELLPVKGVRPTRYQWDDYTMQTSSPFWLEKQSK
jgi:hypothetical protein